MLLVAKDAEIRSLISHQDTIVAANAELRSSLTKSMEENKLLKRAVSIQDSRNKEALQQNEILAASNRQLQQQNNQREAVLSQAADCVARLESENRYMREYIESLVRSGQIKIEARQDDFDGGSYGGFPEGPPPDVF